MTVRLQDEQAIFEAARKAQSPELQQAILDQQCGDDAELKHRITSLLQAYHAGESFLESPPPGLEFALSGTEFRSIDQPLRERVGTIIGPYKLLQQIGEGGMGTVYMAEQTEPISRKVALKIIKPGMDSRQVIARFEAERQALAMMDHVNIARVLDAGTTESGRPYFVMELVHGVPITKYCDDNHLTPRQRLELFVPVCQAIQHAHQKGIIHRDIKPSNVMVTLYDGKPVPKVIDFGVAKATEQRLTERTLFTQYGTMVGTLEYMSPEQAEMSALGADTRSDIYSLGVLFYELLTGSTPLSSKRMKEAAYAEILRLIKEEEPPKPSTRLSESGEALASISAQRHMEPAKLTKLMRGELDWIVMKTLEKDRDRRYETATGLAQDIGHYLADEQVQACPPSAGYRLRKFARRNKVPLAFTALGLLILLILIGGFGWNVRDRAAREEQLAQERTARQAKVSGQLELILDEVARLELAEKWSDALVAARRAEPALAADEASPDIQERVRRALADLKLVERLEEIRAQSGTTWSDADVRQDLAASAERDYAAAFREAGIDIDRLSVKESAERINARSRIAAALLPVLDDWVAVRSVSKDEAATRRLIDVLQGADPDPWRQQMRDALVRKDWPALDILVKSPDLDRQPAATLSFLSVAIRASGKYLDAELVLRHAQWKYPADFWISHRLGVDLIWLQDPESVKEGMEYLRAAVALRPQSGHSMLNLGNGYDFLGQHDQAIACYRKAIELNPHSPNSYLGLGSSLEEKGQNEEAIAAYEQAIKCKPDYAAPRAALSMILCNCPESRLRNPHRAEEVANKAVEIEPQASNNWTALGMARYRLGQWQEARMAFDKSLQLGTGSWGGALREADAIDWFFLAMSNWQLGQQDQARQCYDRGTQWMKTAKPWETDDEELRRFRAEAEELLGVNQPKPSTAPQPPENRAPNQEH